jgi:hypothetical protein
MASLRDCPQFMEAIERMKAADISQKDKLRESDRFSDSVGFLPWNRAVLRTYGGYLLRNDLTL